MKIVYLVANINRCGPYNVIESIFMNYYDKKNITIISLFDTKNDDKLISKLKSCGINIIILKLNKYSFLIDGSRKLMNEIYKINPDVVHSNCLQSDLIVKKNKKFKYKLVNTIHNNMYEDYIFKFGNIQGKLWIYFHKKALKKFDNVICCAKNIYEVLRSKNISCTFIRNGIKIKKCSDSIFQEKKAEKEKLISSYKLRNDAIIYFFYGVLNNRKAPSELIRKFVKNHDENEYLFIDGEGEEFDICNKIKDDNVIMLGYINNPESYYLASDIYISNSKSEGLSISVLDALSYGDFLLLFDIPSHRECINLSSNLYLGEVFNDMNFCNSKKILINNIKNHKIEIKKINMLISEEKMANSYFEIYKEVKK